MFRRLLPLLLVACQAADPKDDTADSDTLQAEDSEAESDAGTDSDPAPVDTEVVPVDTEVPVETDLPVGETTLRGSILGPTGALLSAVSVQFCRNTTCYSVPVDEGRYELTGIEAGAGSFHVVPLGDPVPALADVYLPLDLVDGRIRTVDVRVAALAPSRALPSSPEPLELTDGLYLTVGAGQLIRPNPFVPEATAVAAADISATPPPTDRLDAEPLAIYYLYPFDYPTSAPLPVRVRNDWGLASDEATLYVADYASYTWVAVGPLEDDGDGGLVLHEGVGLEVMSTLVVARP